MRDTLEASLGHRDRSYTAHEYDSIENRQTNGSLGLRNLPTGALSQGAAQRNTAAVTAELADLAVDQCTLVEGRFTMIAPDDYRGDTLDVKLWDSKENVLAAESLYADDADE